MPAVQKNHGADYVSESKNNKNKQDTNMKTENRNRNVVRLTESQLKQIVSESVKSILRESEEPIYGVEMYEFDGNVFSQATDWDFASQQYTKGEAMQEAEYYLQNNPDLETVVRVYNKKTGETVQLFV